MNSAYDLNVNSTACLQTMNDFGVARVTNVCTGTVVEVPWGVVEWVLAVGLSCLAVTVFIMLAAMAFSMLATRY